MDFNEKLALASEKNRSLVCVGLDSDPAQLPPGVNIFQFNRAIVAATADLVCAYKMNLAFYEVLEDGGAAAIRNTLDAIPEHIPVIGDAKRGDIGNTSEAYAWAIFENLGFDAITVSPYMGHDSLQPFIDYHDRGVFVLCRTSNQGGADFQDLEISTTTGPRKLYELVGEAVAAWNTNGNLGLVVGATRPEELKSLRTAHPDMPFLIPGIGAQSGDLELTVRNGTDVSGKKAIINSSRQIIFASRGADYAEAAESAARELRDKINLCLE